MTFKPDMTLEQIKNEELDALDKLCAEKIMGYIREQNYYLQAGINGAIIDWQPTRNISQAFQLLEKFKGKGFHLSWGYGEYRCDIGEDDEYAETAPLAIVKACLKAVKAI